MGFMKWTAAAVLGAMVAGCGGGRGDGTKTTTPVAAGPGGSPPATVTPDGSWLTFTPSPVSLTAYEREVLPFQILATASRNVDKPFNVAIIDGKGVIAPEVTLIATSERAYVAGLRTALLAAGSHETRLEVRLCEDDPLVCGKPLPGSPWYVPLSVTVLNSAQSQGRMRFSPAAFDLVTYQGEPVPFTLDATPLAVFDKPVRVGFVNNDGLLAQAVTANPAGTNQYTVQLTTSPTLAPGEYTSSIEVRVCYDDPVECRSPVTGSPWRVPLKLSVKSGGNLTALAPIAGLSAWSTYNGNATQNAFLPVSFDPAHFSRRWNTTDVAAEAGAPVADNGRVFVSRAGSNGQWTLTAMSEASGEVLWRYDLGPQKGAAAVATGNGRVLVFSTSSTGGTLWTLDQASGQLLGKTGRAGMIESRRAPAVIGNAVYLGEAGGMARIDAGTGLVEWENRNLSGPSPYWTPTVDGSLAYTVLNNRLYALNTNDGSTAFNIEDAQLAWNDTSAKTIAVNGQLGIVKVRDRLVAYDLQTRTRKWVAETFTMGQPVLAGGTVYSLGESGLVLEARAADTGMLQWKSGWLYANSTDASGGHLIVTSNLAFVSSAKGTMAVDLATRKIVWNYPFGGELAISDRGVLYITRSTGMLAAINLR